MEGEKKKVRKSDDGLLDEWVDENQVSQSKLMSSSDHAE